MCLSVADETCNERAISLSFLEAGGADAEQPLIFNHSHHSRPDRTDSEEGRPGT